MQRSRPFTPQRISGLGFIAVVLSVIAFTYYVFVALTWGPSLACAFEQSNHIQAVKNTVQKGIKQVKGRSLQEQETGGGGNVVEDDIPMEHLHTSFTSLIYLESSEDCATTPLSQPFVLFLYTLMIVFHILFANLLITFFQCMMTDPGVVPPNWGFYMGDETKRRRYCKMCNVWKPDRTHHCSICNRCILNMDHHCPWINNCVGFYNRKFFMQLLFYVYFTVSLVFISSLPDLYFHAKLAYDAENYSLGSFMTNMKTVSIALDALLLITLTNFIRFHIGLVKDNFTTIENLEREEGVKSKWDIGVNRNCEQVFGPNPWLYAVPFHLPASRPVGDGVRWRVHYTRVLDEDEELPGDGGTQNTSQPEKPQQIEMKTRGDTGN